MSESVEVKRFPVTNRKIHAIRHCVGKFCIDAVVTSHPSDEVISDIVEYYKIRRSSTYATNGHSGGGYLGMGAKDPEQQLKDILREGLEETPESLFVKSLLSGITRSIVPPDITHVTFDIGNPHNSEKKFEIAVGLGAYLLPPERLRGRYNTCFIFPEKENQLLITYLFGSKGQGRDHSRDPFPHEIDFLNNL